MAGSPKITQNFESGESSEPNHSLFRVLAVYMFHGHQTYDVLAIYKDSRPLKVGCVYAPRKKVELS